MNSNNVQRYIPLWDQSLNDGAGGWLCGNNTCRSPYWVATQTDVACEYGHEVDPVALDEFYDHEV